MGGAVRVFQFGDGAGTVNSMKMTVEIRLKCAPGVGFIKKAAIFVTPNFLKISRYEQS